MLGVTFDGATVNRKLVKIHDLNTQSVVYNTPNPYAAEGPRNIFFFSDILLKQQGTARIRSPDHFG